MRRITATVAKAAILAFAMLMPAAGAHAAEAVKPPDVHFSFDGIFGTFDRAQLQRGFQVYNQVCASCHAASLLTYRNLVAIGMTPDQATEVAGTKEVQDGPNDQGEMFTRSGRLSDRFVSPFPNEQAARFANGGAYPPDLSLIAKAREGGADYLHALLVGYRDAPAGVEVREGLYYNEYYPGHMIAMPPPMADGQVEYSDGTTSSIDNMSRDVSAFLMFAADPHMEDRKRMGVKAILFLLVLTAMLYAVKRKVWAEVH